MMVPSSDLNETFAEIFHCIFEIPATLTNLLTNRHFSLQTITSSEVTIETLEQRVKFVQS